MFQSNDNDDMFSLTQHVTLPKIIPCAVIQGEVGDIRTKWMDERRKHWIRVSDKFAKRNCSTRKK
jgi:hypothetical protein